MKNRKIILNQVRTPDGTILRSRNKHDFRTHKDEVTGEIYVVDGGLDFLGRSVNEVPAEEMSLYDDEPHYVIRQYAEWGTRGPNGTDPLRYVAIKDLSDRHINAILKTQKHLGHHFRQILRDEVDFRSSSSSSRVLN